MVADVSSLVRIMEDGKAMNNESGGGGGKSAALITRDLLGGGRSSFDSKELDLDLQVPSGWEKRLDLKSGKVYLQRCNSPNTSSSSNSLSSSLDHKHQYYHDLIPKLQDLTSIPLSKTPLNLFDDSSLELKLVSSKTNYQSVCTLDKVKYALERAKREPIKKRCISKSKSSSPPLDSSPSSTNETVFHCKDKSCSPSSSSLSFAAGCPSCLLYVLITNNNPKCPRCNTVVPSPNAMKKPRIDLNISI